MTSFLCFVVGACFGLVVGPLVGIVVIAPLVGPFVGLIEVPFWAGLVAEVPTGPPVLTLSVEYPLVVTGWLVGGGKDVKGCILGKIELGSSLRQRRSLRYKEDSKVANSSLSLKCSKAFVKIARIAKLSSLDKFGTKGPGRN